MKFKKKLAVLLASTLAISTALVGCSSTGGDSSGGVEINVNVGPEPATIDPAKKQCSRRSHTNKPCF